jgi:hypothetical protein
MNHVKFNLNTILISNEVNPSISHHIVSSSPFTRTDKQYNIKMNHRVKALPRAVKS